MVLKPLNRHLSGPKGRDLDFPRCHQREEVLVVGRVGTEDQQEGSIMKMPQ